MKKDFYQELFQQEYNAHKYTISKNMELKNTVNRLLEINDKLLKSIQSFDSDKSILISEIIRLKKLVKEEDYDKR
jgi:formaldehyde-activating enzyme involved in methanogenesis